MVWGWRSDIRTKSYAMAKWRNAPAMPDDGRFCSTIEVEMHPNVLTIAGSDPSGGAGIQADLKTFSALGVYGASVITALTAQNTQGVRGFTVVEPDFVAAQINSVFEDLRIDAVKIGMVATAAVAMAIAGRLRHYKPRNVVLDPVMVAKSGDRLPEVDADAAISGQLVPLATVITPNLPEAAVLCGEA